MGPVAPSDTRLFVVRADTLEPWSGAIEENQLEEDLYRTVIVEVEGRRLRVGVPSAIFGTSSAIVRQGKAPNRRVLHSLPSSTGLEFGGAPFQATVEKVAAMPGDSVAKGDLLMVLEAMKMEQPVLAGLDGVVDTIDVMVGDSVVSGFPICSITPVDQA